MRYNINKGIPPLGQCRLWLPNIYMYVPGKKIFGCFYRRGLDSREIKIGYLPF